MAPLSVFCSLPFFIQDDKEECDISERSLLNESLEAVMETKGDFSFHKVSLQDAASESPPGYAGSFHNQRRS